MKERILVDNTMPALFPDMPSGGGGEHGRIYTANDDNFDAQHLSQPLTEYIVGVEDDQDLEATLNAIAPMVPVSRSFTYRQHDEREAFQHDGATDEDIREIGGDFATVKRTGKQMNGRCDNKGLIMPLDHDQGGEDTAIQQAAVRNLRNRLLRSELYRTEALLEANDTEDSINWGPSNDAADPDTDVLTNVDLSGDARGIDSNLVVFGGGADVRRKRALRRSLVPGIAQTAGDTPEQLASFYGVDQVVKTKARYQSSKTAKSKIFDSKVYIYYAASGLMKDDPSNLKRFVMVTEGGPFRVYIIPMLKKTLVCVEHYSSIAITSTLGIRKILVTFT